MSIEIERSLRQQAIESLQRYFREQLEQPIGDLPADLLLGYIIEEIGPLIYNQAVADVQKALLAKVSEVDIEVHENEFPYWRKKKRS